MVWECPGNGVGMVRNGLGMLLLHPGIRSPIPLFSSSRLGRSLRGLLSFPAFLWEREQDFVTFHHSQTFFGKGEQDSMAFHHSHLSSGRDPPHSHSPSPPGPNPSRSRIPGVFSRQEFGCCPPAARARPWWGGGGGGRIPAAAAAAPAFFSGGEGPAFPGNPAEQDPAPGKRNPGGGNPSPAPRDPRGTKNVTALLPTFPGSFSFGRLRILSFFGFSARV